ncbi:uncharacterized protein GLRG_11848 [Colletotrichum graminicola M1.001]|uniref:Uncharacterized protein n=1 Tax=Colletotrichum graminicola (strain M1.001 / M2 / FGSC 10212) TaxID=645133 RepID=E3R0S4_COLGM|nr:uncharacterized protein GLRG_11848 [Colletotrichum graminicola M1.001]EFQ36712.1 hypothetical protein GLRG_11848 [Colletotrichum graminicola M1.001]
MLFKTYLFVLSLLAVELVTARICIQTGVALEPVKRSTAYALTLGLAKAEP